MTKIAFWQRFDWFARIRSSRIYFLSSSASFSCREIKNNGFVAKDTNGVFGQKNLVVQKSFERWFS